VGVGRLVGGEHPQFVLRLSAGLRQIVLVGDPLVVWRPHRSLAVRFGGGQDRDAPGTVRADDGDLGTGTAGSGVHLVQRVPGAATAGATMMFSAGGAECGRPGTNRKGAAVRAVGPGSTGVFQSRLCVGLCAGCLPDAVAVPAEPALGLTPALPDRGSSVSPATSAATSSTPLRQGGSAIGFGSAAPTATASARQLWNRSSGSMTSALAMTSSKPQHATESVDIATAVEGLALDLFGGRIVERCHHTTGGGESRRLHLDSPIALATPKSVR